MPKKLIPENFCSAPFLNLQVSKDGLYGPCPHTPNLWQNKFSIKDKWQSEEMQKLRNNFLQNKKDSQCKRCWDEEKNGTPSLRQRLQKFKGTQNVKKVFEKYISTQQYLSYPRVLTLIPGNECNLACATCSGYFSSKWNSLINQKSYGMFQKQHNNWNLTQEDYKDIVDNSETLQKIELFGGEPFLNKPTEKFLIDKLIEKGTAKHITLYFNTNGTTFNTKLLEKILDNFKFVEIRQSIDGLDEQFEYLRYGAKFDEVCMNAEKFMKLPKSDFEIVCTVSLFNVIDIEKIDNFFIKQSWPVHYNIADHPEYIRLHNLPDGAKDKIVLPANFNYIKQHLYADKCDIRQWYSFVKYTKMLDKNRGLSFANSFKTLYEAVKNYGYE